MRLFEELRSLDTGNPGQWSTRVSLFLGCALFLLVSSLGTQLWVRGHLMPQLTLARESLPELRQRLAASQQTAHRMRTLRTETEGLMRRLRQSGAWMPAGPEAMDLAVSLAAGQRDALVEAVQPWLPTRGADRLFRHAGAELEITGSYAQVLNFFALALPSGQLRELVELSIRSETAEDAGKLRATARLLAYFADEATARLFQAPANGNSRQPQWSIPVEFQNLRSPFGPPGSEAGTIHTADPATPAGAPPRRGLIRVGARSYELLEDTSGKTRLRSRGS